MTHGLKWLALWGAWSVSLVAFTPRPAIAGEFAAVVPGYTMSFPRDHGGHPAFRTEWWYVTGTLRTAQGEDLGFQVTFFRSALPAGTFAANPSAFAGRQLLAAHVAISDPAHGRLWLDQRTARAVMGLAGFAEQDTGVWIDRWRLDRTARGYRADVEAHEFSLQLQMDAGQGEMLNGDGGFSQKAAMPNSASYYYSVPHLAVTGRIGRARISTPVSGQAWLDHEWSSDYLAVGAIGWEWTGINLADGGSLMAFSIRGANGASVWAGATLRDASGRSTRFGPEAVRFEPRRQWRSEATAITYPVAMDVAVGARQFRLEPLMDDQESDARLSTGTVYWEGAMRVTENDHAAGAGYLELTGFGEPLRLQ